jgi:hypothetical protein
MDTSQQDAGCTGDGIAPDLPGTHPAPGPVTPSGMTACKAAPLIQKRIA